MSHLAHPRPARSRRRSPRAHPPGPDVSAGDHKGDQDKGGDPDTDKHKGKAGEPRPQPLGLHAPIRVDLEGMMARAVALPIDPANIAQIDARGDRIYYLTQPIADLSGPARIPPSPRTSTAIPCRPTASAC